MFSRNVWQSVIWIKSKTLFRLWKIATRQCATSPGSDLKCRMRQNKEVKKYCFSFCTIMRQVKVWILWFDASLTNLQKYFILDSTWSNVSVHGHANICDTDCCWLNLHNALSGPIKKEINRSYNSVN